MFANKITAWVLIFSLLFQVCLIPLSAEESSEGAAAPALRRRSVTPARSTGTAAQAEDSEEAPVAAPVERELSTLATTKSRASSAQTTTEQLISARSQATPWAEEIDILSPDDTSPILAESVFGRQGKERINLIADNVEIKAIMDHISKEYRLNLVSSALSAGNRIKTSLYDLPLETVFQVLLEQANLSYEKKHGIVYLQDMGKDQAAFFEERFFQLRDFADMEFARKLIENIATTRGGKTIINEKTRTFFIVEYKRNLDRIEKMLTDLGYLESLDPESNVYFYHYLGYSYVDKSVVGEIVKKYATDKGKSIEDDSSNRYIVFDTKRSFQNMKDALSFVDVPRGQVFVDVMFVDLTDTDRKRLGIDTTVDWNAGTAGADQLVTSLATDVTNFFQLKQPNHLTNLKVTGIKENSKSNILNNPKLMVMNNESATIDVTENFPYVINENNSGVISSKIMQIPIGVQLSVKPRINANREVEMEVEPVVTVLKEVKNITTKVIDTNQANQKVTETSSEFPITDERKIKTSVTVPSGRTLVLGGLIKESDRKTADTIPGLSRLPLLGRLFRRDTNAEDKSQLYIFITPTIVRNAPVSSAFTKDYGPERTAYFPTGTIEQEREKMRGLIMEKADGSAIASSQNTTGTGPLFTERVKAPAEPRTVATTMAAETSVVDASDLSKVDFSEFVRKISRFKDMQRAEKQQKAESVQQTEQREAGFQTLLERLRDDIEQKEESTATGVTTSAVVTTPVAEVVLPSMAPQDEVLGERAARVAQLLEMWEKRPVENIKTAEELAKKSEMDKKAESGSELSNDSATQGSSSEQMEKKPEEKISESTAQSGQEKPTPAFEQKIQLEMFSPLITGDKEKRRLLQPGEVRFGNGYSEVTPKKTVQEPTPQAGEEPAPASGQPNPAPLRRRRIGTETSALPTGERQNNGQYAMAANKTEVAISEAGADWEKDFFQNGVAHVLITNMEDSMMMDSDGGNGGSLKPAPAQIAQNTVQTVPEEVSTTVVNQVVVTDIQDEVASQDESERLAQQKMNARRTAEEMFRQTGVAIATGTNRSLAQPSREMKIHSDDPRTRQIFENLFAQRSEMAQPSPQREPGLEVRNMSDLPSVAALKIESGVGSEPAEKARVVQADGTQVAEQEFSNFLEAMFNASSVDEKLSSPEAVKKNSLSRKETLKNSEKELMEFLNRL